MPELIDRQAALAEIEDTIKGSLQRPEDVYIDKGLMMTRTIIEKLPSVEAEPVRYGRWIPCSERLPDNKKPCAVVTENCGLGVSRMLGRNRMEWTLFGERVIYWMPIPEPPTEVKLDGR